MCLIKSVTGVSNISATGTSVVTLNNPNNDFDSIKVAAGSGTVTLIDVNDISLDDSTLGGLFDVTADNINIIGNIIAGSLIFRANTGTGGTITDEITGDLTVVGTSTFLVDPAGSILLDSPTNSFGGAVTFSSILANLTLSSLGSIVIGGVTVEKKHIALFQPELHAGFFGYFRQQIQRFVLCRRHFRRAAALRQ